MTVTSYNVSQEEDGDKSKRPLLNQTDSPTQINTSHLDKANVSDNTNETSVMIVGTQGEQIKDRVYLVYCIFLLFGIANLMPWNVFITAEDYFVKHKLNTNTSENATYKNDFVFYIGITGQTTNVLMNIFNIFVPIPGNPKNRIPYTIVLAAVVLVFHVGLAIVDSSSWPFVFFIVCLASIVIMQIATGIMQSCIFYVSSWFPMEYAGAIIIGNNLCGIYCSLMNIISKATSSNYKIAAIYYFLSAFIIVMFSFIGFFAMHRTKFYRFWSESYKLKMKENQEQSTSQTVQVPYLLIIKKIWPLLFSIWLNFFSCLAIFPVFQLGIRPYNDSFVISDKWFQDFTTFLTFNVFACIGNLLPRIVTKPGPKILPIAVIIRALLAFLFFAFSNYRPDLRVHLPVLIQNDYVYWAGSAFLALVYGHLASLLMMYTPKQVDIQHSGTAGMFSVLALVIGVVTGLQFSKVFTWLVVL